MADAPQQTLPMQPSVAQFGLRGLAITVAIAAVISAALSPWVRSLDERNQVTFAAAWGGFILGVLGNLAVNCYMRRRAERLAGHRYLSLANPTKRRRPWLTSLIAIAGFVAMATFLGQIGNRPGSGLYGWKTVQSIFWGIIYGGYAAWAITRLWWNRVNQSIELCEHGLIFAGMGFVPWKRYTYFTWGIGGTSLQLQQKGWRHFATVPIELHDEVNEIVSRYLPQK